MAGQRWWRRTCSDCRRYQHHESGSEAGKVETQPKPDGKGGAIFLPMVRAPNCSPPCEECPKVPPDAPVKSWEHAVEFEAWFWDALKEYEELHECGGLMDADPLMRSLAVVFRRYRLRNEARILAEPVIDYLHNAFFTDS